MPLAWPDLLPTILKFFKILLSALACFALQMVVHIFSSVFGDDQPQTTNRLVVAMTVVKREPREREALLDFP
jgi:hypothetical protein